MRRVFTPVAVFTSLLSASLIAGSASAQGKPDPFGRDLAGAVPSGEAEEPDEGASEGAKKGGWRLTAKTIPALSPEQRKTFWGTKEDPAPKELDGVTDEQKGKHYATGNEWNLHLFYPALKNLGGGYVGVGTDQAYMFIGWMRPDFAWLMDYDPVVADIHRAYHAFFAVAKTPAELIDLWRLENKARGLEVIDAAYADDDRTRRSVRSNYIEFRGFVVKRLEKVAAAMREAGVPTFVNDQESYDFVKALVASGRVRPLVGNLLGWTGMKGVAAAARELGVPIRALYVSNAEQYWKYTKRYRDNVRRMPVDDKSLFVRTLLTWERNQDYRYVVQPYANFLAWLDKSWVYSVKFIPRRTDESKDVEFLVFDRDPDVEEEFRKKKGWL